LTDIYCPGRLQLASRWASPGDGPALSDLWMSRHAPSRASRCCSTSHRSTWSHRRERRPRRAAVATGRQDKLAKAEAHTAASVWKAMRVSGAREATAAAVWVGAERGDLAMRASRGRSPLGFRRSLVLKARVQPEMLAALSRRTAGITQMVPFLSQTAAGFTRDTCGSERGNCGHRDEGCGPEPENRSHHP
jgi:hypothetical protein